MAVRTEQRRAFTIVELLVVIAIIGVLVALLLPAVQAARESARATQCRNNMKQITTAMQAYHETHNKFPTNWGNANGSLGHSWLTYILSRMELQPIYDRIAIGRAVNYRSPPTDNTTVAMTPIDVFKCPSDSHEGTLPDQILGNGQSGSWAVTNYKSVGGANWGSLSGSDFRYRKADDGLSGRNATSYDGLDYGDGLICRGKGGAAGKPIETSLADVQRVDGSTHTFAIGEAIPELCNWSAWYSFDGATGTCGIPLNYSKPGMMPADMATDRANNSGFRSYHSGGANFGMCDGSVQFVGEHIDMALYHGLATVDGGEQAELP